MADRPTVFFVAGEPSGDQHAAMLGEAISARRPVNLVGVGQQAMRQAGFDLIFDSADWSGIGLAESLKRVPHVYRRALAVRDWIVRHQPGLLILVDFGAFNVRLARAVRKRLRVPTLYYFPPKSWSRRASGYGRLAGVIDRWATPFQWSAEILRSEGLDATWVGHPVVDRISPADDRGALRDGLGLDPDATIIGLMPGSRSFEVGCNGPVQLGAARIIGEHIANTQTLISVAPSIGRERIERLVARAGIENVRLLAGTADIARASDIVITTCGTATLEVAAAACPMVLTYGGTLLMKIENVFRRMDRTMVGMPNILADRMIVPEILAAEATPGNVAAEALDILTNRERRERMRRDLMAVRSRLGESGVSDRTAEIAIEMLVKTT